MMVEYIEKNVAIARLTALEISNPRVTMTDAKRQIADTRPADVAPVVHGRWKRYGKNLGECSECGEIVSVRSNYCPNCGCKMESN